MCAAKSHLALFFSGLWWNAETIGPRRTKPRRSFDPRDKVAWLRTDSHAFETLDNLVSRPVWFQSETKMFASASIKHPCAALKTAA